MDIGSLTLYSCGDYKYNSAPSKIWKIAFPPSTSAYEMVTFDVTSNDNLDCEVFQTELTCISAITVSLTLD